MKKLLLAALMIPALSGCIMIKENKQPLVNNSLILNDQQQKPAVFISFKTSNNKTRPVDLGEASYHAEYFKSSLLNSRCCTIAGSKQQADIIVEGSVKPINNRWILIPALISAGSLFIIPYWDKKHLETELTITMANGQKRQYKLDDSVTLYNWLPIIVLSILPPTMVHNQTAVPSTATNLYNNFLYKMKREETLKLN